MSKYILSFKMLTSELNEACSPSNHGTLSDSSAHAPVKLALFFPFVMVYLATLIYIINGHKECVSNEVFMKVSEVDIECVLSIKYTWVESPHKRLCFSTVPTIWKSV